jgi:hypothetical protein
VEVRGDETAREQAGQREDVAVGEVDQLQDSIDQRVAERDQRIDRALRQADQEDVEEVGRVVDQVVGEPGYEQGDEAQPDEGQDGRPLASPRRAPRRLFGSSFYRDPRDSRATREGVQPSLVADPRFSPGGLA